MGNFLISHSVDTGVERDPKQIAFRSQGVDLNFAELSRKRAQVAAWLIDSGLRRGDRVGIYCRRSLESAIAIYGVMLAGGAFVPIDPDAAPGWMESVIQDCGLNHLICDFKTAGSARRLLRDASLPIQHVLGLEREEDLEYRGESWQAMEGYSLSESQLPSLREADLAYIMYTSGSTGLPKGIMHTHFSGLHYARLSSALYGLEPTDRIANHSPLHFDMSTLGFLTGPFVGATTVMIPEAYTKFPASLSGLVESDRLTIWYSVPTALIQMLHYGALEKRDCRSLRWVLYGGEPFALKHLERLMTLWPQARFSNVYGPAEVNQCTYFHFSRADLAGLDALSGVPIGRCWSRTDGLILDESDMPLKGAMVSGELVVSTVTMMKGYWNRPALTEAAFVTLADGSGKEQVYYRTGDLVRRDQEGRFQFLGRKDRQVKLRGYRVELDGVEGVLTSHAAVEEGAVYLKAVADPAEGESEDFSLYATVQLRSGEGISGNSLIEFLEHKLPHYAVPRRIDIVESLPRTGSGKIDRRALSLAGSVE